MSSHSAFFDDARVNHLTVGDGWQKIQMCSITGALISSPVMDNNDDDLVLASGSAAFLQFRVVDDVLFLLGRVSGLGQTGGTKNSEIFLYPGRIPGLGNLVPNVSERFSYGQCEFTSGISNVHGVGPVYQDAASEDRLRFLLTVGDNGGTLFSMERFGLASLNAATDPDFTKAGVFTFSAVIPLARIDQ